MLWPQNPSRRSPPIWLEKNQLGTVHLFIRDAIGNSAIIQYIVGRQVIHHDRKYQVMTNSPLFERQLALDDWKEIGGRSCCPVTIRAADRFVRASFYINAMADLFLCIRTHAKHFLGESE